MWTTHILADIPIKSCPHGIVDNIGFIHIEFSNVFPSTACTRFHASFPVVFLRFSQRISGLFSMERSSRARAVHVSREAPVRTFARNTADRIAAALWAPPSPSFPHATLPPHGPVIVYPARPPCPSLRFEDDLVLELLEVLADAAVLLHLVLNHLEAVQNGRVVAPAELRADGGGGHFA